MIGRCLAWARARLDARRAAGPKRLSVPPPLRLSAAHRQLLLAEQIGGIGYWRLSVPDGTMEWSAETYRIYGIDPAGGRPSVADAIAAYHPEDRQAVGDTLEAAIRDAAGYSTQGRLRRPDGDIRHLLSRGLAELGPDGRVTALFGVVLDVTEERRAAQAAEAAQLELQAVTQRAREVAEASNDNLHRLARHLERALGRAELGSQAKSRFLTGMSHELRTPLNGLLGHAQLMRMDGGLNEVQLGRLGSMLEAGQHLLEMINRVLDLSEVEAGRMDLRRAGMSEAMPAAVQAPPAAAMGDALRVLVVDDVEMNRAVAAGFLEAAGHAVTGAGGGEAAIQAIRTAPFDLVFMDIRMPGMDGLEATRRIRAMSAGRDIPIVALTAQAFADQIDACREAGMDGHLSKPFTPQTLAAAIGDGIAAAARRRAPVCIPPPADPEPPAFDPVALDRIAALLPPEDLAAHLATLAARCAAILPGLARPAAAALADEVHAVAGSAGLFGFLRLAEAARRLEHAARNGAPHLPEAARRLADQIEPALRMIANLAPASLAA